MTRLGTTGTDNFETNVIGVGKLPFGSYNSSGDPTNLSPDMLVYGSYNVYKTIRNTIASRPGLKRRGSADTTVAGVKSSWEWNTWDARTLPLRICNGKLEVESDIVTSGTFVWYTLLSSLTKNYWVFDAWWDNTNKKDALLMVDGTAKTRNWSGAMAIFLSYAATVITIDRDATTAGFTTSGGSVLIGGVTYTYTGVSGSTLTGTSDASAAVANSVVLEAVNSNSFSSTPPSTYLADFLKVIGNQVYIGSYTSRVVYISKNSSYTDFSQATPRVPGDGDVLTLDNTAKGITVKKGNPWIAAGTSDWYEISFSQITVGTTLSEQVKVDKKPTSTLSAPLRHEFIDTVGDQIICLTQDQQVRIIGEFRNQFTTKYPTLSLALKTELVAEDFTGGHLRCIGDFIYITAPNAGRTYLHETREELEVDGSIRQLRFWHPPQVNGVSRYAVISGIVYGHSNANPQIYRVWDTGQWFDDSPSNDQLPYTCVMLLAYHNIGRRQGKLSFDKLFVEGYAAAANLYAGIYYDYQGSTALLSPILNTSADPFTKTFTGVIPPSLGDASLGDNPLGDGLNTAFSDQALLPKFKEIVTVEQTDCYEYALMVYSQNASARWEILAIGTNAELSFAQGVELVK